MLPRFFKSSFGLFLMALLVLLMGTGSMVGYQIYRVAHPSRVRDTTHPGDFLLRVDDLSLQSTDGVSLSAWLIHGDREGPAIILCHDLGESRSSFLDTVVPLQRLGYNLLLFDFRGHGASEGEGSTLGAEERYDVLGAIDFLRTRRDLDSNRIGVVGVGMGAYAAALAAAERKEVVALALDSLYPDIPSYLDRILFEGVPGGDTQLARYASIFYGPYFRWKIFKGAAAQVIPKLSDRNFLFIGREEHPDSVVQGKKFYEMLPEGGNSDKNLLILEASETGPSYANRRTKYQQALTRFFQSRLPVQEEDPVERIRIQIPKN